jgi:hypothetical protein
LDYRSYVTPTTVSGDAILDDWRWLTGPDLRLWIITKLGDAMLTDPANGSVHFLDTISGTLTQVASSTEAFQSVAQLSGDAEKWFMPDIVDGQAAMGMRPNTDECISFKHPPILGGKLSPDNFETCSVLVHFSLAGQIHKQVKDLPPGTKIGKVNVAQPATGRRPWWRFW